MFFDKIKRNESQEIWNATGFFCQNRRHQFKCVKAVGAFDDDGRSCGIDVLPEIAVSAHHRAACLPDLCLLHCGGLFLHQTSPSLFLSVFGVGLLCQIVYFVVDRSLYLCILITFSLSILTIYGIRFLKQSIKGAKIVQTVLGVLWVAAVLALSYFLSYPPVSPRPYGLRVDYNFFGVLTPVIVYLMPNRWAKLIGLALGLILVALDLGGIQWYALLALLPLAFYRGARGRWKLKYLFYIYYPLHLAALYGIALLLI